MYKPIEVRKVIYGKLTRHELVDHDVFVETDASNGTVNITDQGANEGCINLTAKQSLVVMSIVAIFLADNMKDSK
jgi:hypothetical protein